MAEMASAISSKSQKNKSIITEERQHKIEVD